MFSHLPGRRFDNISVCKNGIYLDVAIGLFYSKRKIQYIPWSAVANISYTNNSNLNKPYYLTIHYNTRFTMWINLDFNRYNNLVATLLEAHASYHKNKD